MSAVYCASGTLVDVGMGEGGDAKIRAGVQPHIQYAAQGAGIIHVAAGIHETGDRQLLFPERREQLAGHRRQRGGVEGAAITAARQVVDGDGDLALLRKTSRRDQQQQRCEQCTEWLQQRCTEIHLPAASTCFWLNATPPRISVQATAMVSVMGSPSSSQPHSTPNTEMRYVTAAVRAAPMR